MFRNILCAVNDLAFHVRQTATGNERRDHPPCALSPMKATAVVANKTCVVRASSDGVSVSLSVSVCRSVYDRLRVLIHFAASAAVTASTGHQQALDRPTDDNNRSMRVAMATVLPGHCHRSASVPFAATPRH